MRGIKYGVSPAFFISKFGENFTPKNVCDSLEVLRELGFTCFQGEIVFDGDIDMWLRTGAKQVRGAAEQQQLSMSQFVAHFMMEAFKDHESVLSPFGISEMEQVFEILDLLGANIPVTVPFGRFLGEISEQVFSDTVSKMQKIAAAAERKGLHLSVEIQPGAVAQGAEGILRFINAIGYQTGYNLDTGHAWASGHIVERFPELLGKAILGSHLCDNDGKTNLSLRPGKGSINFPLLFKELFRSGYQGSFDLEISCRSDEVEIEYSKGLEYIKGFIDEM